MAPEYSDPKVIGVFVLCLALIVASFFLRRKRNRSGDPQFKKLSSSWPTAAAWFGGIGLLLLIARTESISYVSIRFWWVLWTLALLAYLVFQFKQYKGRYYKVVPQARQVSATAKYLPHKKK